MSERRPTMEEINEWVARQAERDVAWTARMRAERRAAQEAAAAARQEQLAKEQAAAERRSKAQAKRRAKEQAERQAKIWPVEKQCRNRIDWHALTGSAEVARLQRYHERGATALRMREVGMSFREIGERMGLSTTRAAQIVAKAERRRRWGRISPIEQHNAWNAALGVSINRPMPTIRRMIATLAVINHTATPRDWLHVGTTVREQVLPVLTVQATGADGAVRIGAGRRLEACHG